MSTLDDLGRRFLTLGEILSAVAAIAREEELAGMLRPFLAYVKSWAPTAFYACFEHRGDGPWHDTAELPPHNLTDADRERLRDLVARWAEGGTPEVPLRLGVPPDADSALPEAAWVFPWQAGADRGYLVVGDGPRLLPANLSFAVQQAAGPLWPALARKRQPAAAAGSGDPRALERHARYLTTIRDELNNLAAGQELRLRIALHDLAGSLDRAISRIARDKR